jgi:hypothetical protein
VIVSEAQIISAMHFHEERHIESSGPLDGVHLPKAVAKLADLLGSMWYTKEFEADIPDGCEMAELIHSAAATGSTESPQNYPRPRE